MQLETQKFYYTPEEYAIYFPPELAPSKKVTSHLNYKN